MREMNIRWNDPQTFGIPFLKKLLCGHDTIGEKSKLPCDLSRFNHYNCPEKHKHRKRAKGNLSSSELSKHVAALHNFLQSSWIKKDQFKCLHDVIEELVASPNTSYLHEVRYSALSVSDSSHSNLRWIPGWCQVERSTCRWRLLLTWEKWMRVNCPSMMIFGPSVLSFCQSV